MNKSIERSGFGLSVLMVVSCGCFEQETEDGEKEKVLSKKARKALAKAEREQEQALAAAFYREFWPENVWFMTFSCTYFCKI
jgi:hypothetical protein